ncbi:CHAP domain-containing protein [Paenarthrobacter sp. TA1.8]|uniref:CHAP domain-containing protein n=1 Tax=Paenarthrobacter sp. TA1.8 TaxID=3400219 RepID=UPI003B42EE12
MTDSRELGTAVAVNVARKGLALKAGIVIAVLFLVYLLVSGPVLMIASTKSNPALAACGPTGTTGGAPVASAKDRAEQVKNAKLIDAAVQKAGFSGKASRIAIITAYGESTLFNLDYGDQINGVRNPDGSLATSFGLFQQQTSQGWGTKEQVMNPEHATLSFLLGPKHDGKSGLAAVGGWEDSSYISSVIHTVQRNADKDHYTKFVGPADSIIKDAGIDVSRPAKGGGDVTVVNAVNKADLTACGGQPGKIGETADDYPFKDVTPGPGIYVADPLGYYYGECTSFAAWRLNRDAAATSAPYRYTSAEGFLFGNAKEWKEGWLSRGWKVSKTPVPGSIAWWGAYGGGTAQEPQFGVGTNGHVAYVQSVTTDGKAVIEEYNNEYYAPPGHRYSVRPEPVDASQINAFLLPPSK